MSEEMIQRALSEGGLPFGDFEYFSIGATSLSALRNAKLIPNRDYAGFETRKPDGLIIDRRGQRPKVIAVVEFKQDLGADDGVAQAATVGAALGAIFCISTDSSASRWFLPDEKGEEHPIKLEDGSVLRTPFVSPESIAKKTQVGELIELVSAISARLVDDQLTPQSTLNPSALARSVWQDIYTAGNTPPPAQALATFVEIFMFKYLSDLGVLDTDENGTEVSFDAVLSKSPEHALKYYKNNVRKYIKSKFPSSDTDKTTIMNGFSLNPDNSDHNHTFRKILKKFKDYETAPDGGLLMNIDREFKSRLFEDFLKGSIGQRSLGQFFTPRRLMAGIVDMADVESLKSGSVVADPACGVGGFPLEAAQRRAIQLGKPEFKLKSVPGKKSGSSNVQVVSDLTYRGYDKGSDKYDENLAIILAKANFVIYQSDLLSAHPNACEAIAGAFNTIFRAYTETSLGSLAEIDEHSTDLILSNPPYITSGTANLREAAKRAGLKYKAGGTGVEGMFVEKIVRELKPGGRAFIVLPDGIFLRSADAKLRQWIAQECFIDGIVSLPVKTFYSVKKKTYVLCITRKSDPSVEQKYPIFSYLLKSFGESLDAERLPTNDSDMPELSRLFRSYMAIKGRMASDPDAAAMLSSPKLKLIDHGVLLGSLSWAIEAFWSREERVALDLLEEPPTLSEDEFFDAVRSLRDNIDIMLKGLEAEGAHDK